MLFYPIFVLFKKMMISILLSGKPTTWLECLKEYKWPKTPKYEKNSDHTLTLNPYSQKNIDKLEKVQRRFTKIPSNLRKRQLSERIENMNLMNHKNRRQRGELIQQFKLVNDLDRVNWHVEPQIIAKSGRLRRELVKTSTQTESSTPGTT